MDGDAPHSKPRGCSSNLALLAWGLAASWLLLFFWPLPLLFEIPLGLHLMVRKSPLRFLSLLLSSTTVLIVGSTLSTLVGYFAGGVSLYDPHLGHEQGIIGSFSPRYRCDYWWLPGDLGPPPVLSLVAVPNVFTFRACYKLFGPAKHTYHGALPNRQYAAAVAGSKQCQQIPMAQFMTGRFTVAKKNIRLLPGTVAAALHGIKRRDPGRPVELDATQAATVYAELYQGQCLILLAPGTSKHWVERPDASSIVSLVDPTTGNLIAQELF